MKGLCSLFSRLACASALLLPIIVLSMSEKGAVKKAVLGQRIGTLVA